MRRLTVPPSLVNTVQSDTFPHLTNLELDKLACWVSISVILDQEFVGLLVFTVGEQESGRLGDEKDSDHDDGTGESLEDQGDLPRQV